MNRMLPQYSTVLFSEVWDDVDDFKDDYTDAGIPVTISLQSATTLFYLLYARYGNNPIANDDELQFKMKILALDTSGQNCSVCIMNEEKVICDFNLSIGTTHSETLLPMIDEVCNKVIELASNYPNNNKI